MGGPLPVVLTIGPLTLYFLALATWHASRGPRIVSGPTDAAWLGFALGGLAAFGPIGQALTADLPGGLAVPALLTGLAVAGMGLTTRARRRIAIYNVDPDSLDEALAGSLAELSGEFAKTLRGFEHPSSRCGLRVETSAVFRVAEVEAFGPEAEALIVAIRPRLRRRLRDAGARGLLLARFWLSLSSLTVTAPVAVYLLGRPQARAALRALIERLRGG